MAMGLVDGKCSTHGIDLTKIFGRNSERRDYLRNLDVDGSGVSKQDVRAYVGFLWFRVLSSGRLS